LPVGAPDPVQAFGETTYLLEIGRQSCNLPIQKIASDCDERQRGVCGEFGVEFPAGSGLCGRSGRGVRSALGSLGRISDAMSTMSIGSPFVADFDHPCRYLIGGFAPLVDQGLSQRMVPLPFFQTALA